MLWIMNYNVQFGTVTILGSDYLSLPDGVSRRKVRPKKIAERVLARVSFSAWVLNLGRFSKFRYQLFTDLIKYCPDVQSLSPACALGQDQMSK